MPISTLGPNALASSSVTRPKIGYAGAVLQVVQKVDSTTTSLSGEFSSYTGLDLTVVPAGVNSKFLISYMLRVGSYQYSRRVILKINGAYANTQETGAARGSSGSIYIDSTYSSASIFEHNGEFLYSNSGTANVAISFELYNQNFGNAPIFVNRAAGYNDDQRGRPTSTLTVWEIAG